METRQEKGPNVALFYCQSIPGAGEEERQELEARYNGRLRLFPLPCSGRMEPLHLLKALEEFADGAFLITCPTGACRYIEGNTRAFRRVEAAGEAVSEIGLGRERVGVLADEKGEGRTLAQLAAKVMDMAGELGPSPVHGPR